MGREVNGRVDYGWGIVERDGGKAVWTGTTAGIEDSFDKRRTHGLEADESTDERGAGISNQEANGPRLRMGHQDGRADKVKKGSASILIVSLSDNLTNTKHVRVGLFTSRGREAVFRVSQNEKGVFRMAAAYTVVLVLNLSSVESIKNWVASFSRLWKRLANARDTTTLMKIFLVKSGEGFTNSRPLGFQARLGPQVEFFTRCVTLRDIFRR